MLITRNTLRCIALVLLVIVEAQGAQEESRGFEGTWIIDQHPHDLAIENGLAAGEYPVLSITDTGNIRAYRFGVPCGYDNMSDSEEEVTNDKQRCLETSSVRQTDLIDGPGTLVFIGGLVQTTQSVWRVESPDKDYLRSKIESVKLRLTRIDGIPFAYDVFHQLLNRSLELSRMGERLTIRSRDSEWQVSFVKVSKEDIADAGATLSHMIAPNREYFRCILNTYSTANRKSHSLAKELTELRHIVRKYARASNELDNLRFEMEFANDDSKHRLNEVLVRVALERAELDSVLSTTPASLANDEGKLGQYLNCGERDYQ